MDTQRRHVGSRGRRIAEVALRLHQPAPFLKEIAAAVGSFNVAAYGMCEAHLNDVFVEGRELVRPVRECRAEAVRCHVLRIRRSSVCIVVTPSGVASN
jgi:hypothetical protein